MKPPNIALFVYFFYKSEAPGDIFRETERGLDEPQQRGGPEQAGGEEAAAEGRGRSEETDRANQKAD